MTLAVERDVKTPVLNFVLHGILHGIACIIEILLLTVMSHFLWFSLHCLQCLKALLLVKI